MRVEKRISGKNPEGKLEGLELMLLLEKQRELSGLKGSLQKGRTDGRGTHRYEPTIRMWPFPPRTRSFLVLPQKYLDERKGGRVSQIRTLISGVCVFNEIFLPHTQLSGSGFTLNFVCLATSSCVCMTRLYIFDDSSPSKKQAPRLSRSLIWPKSLTPPLFGLD